jgi:hypothetical protein
MKSSRWMKLVVLVLSLLICIPGLVLAQTGGGSGGGTGGSGGGTGGGTGGGVGSVNGRSVNSTFRANNPMPVLIYTVWGFGSAGINGGSVGKAPPSRRWVSGPMTISSGGATPSRREATFTVLPSTV